MTRYAAVSVLGLAFFFFLHHLGNSIPFSLAKQRFAETNIAGWETCELAAMVMGGAQAAQAGNAVADAVLPKAYKYPADTHGDVCREANDAAGGRAMQVSGLAKTRYMWGQKALFAIALRWFSAGEIHTLIKYASYAAYLLLAAALLAFGWRAFIVAAPAVVFGVFLSGIPKLSDVGVGIAYLWAVFAAAMLALLVKRRMQYANLFCFFAGMTSAFFWFSKGENFLLVALFGLIGWLGALQLQLGGAKAVRSAVQNVALYVAGFVLCFALGIFAKEAAFQLTDARAAGYLEVEDGTPHTGVLDDLLRRVDYRADILLNPGDYPTYKHTAQNFTLNKYFKAAGVRAGFGNGLAAVSAIALLAAASIAGLAARRGRRETGRGVLWLGALILAAGGNIIIPNDFELIAGRLVFVQMALCWSALLFALLQFRRVRASAVPRKQQLRNKKARA